MVKKKKCVQWTGQLVINQRVKSLVKRKVLCVMGREGKPDKLVKVIVMGISTDDETGEKIRIAVCRNTKSGSQGFLVRPEQLLTVIKGKTNETAMKALLKMGFARWDNG